MICPRCKASLLVSNTYGIEIDYCPQCNGVWLDRGELEKVIEYSSRYSNASADYSGHHEKHDHHHDRHDNHHDNHHENYRMNDPHGFGYTPRRKRGFLSDLFDF